MLVKIVLAGGGKGSYSPAVKTAPQRYDCVPARAVLRKRIFPCHLAGPFVCFCARIGKEDLSHPRARTGRNELFGKSRSCVAQKIVTGMVEFRGLFRDRLDQRRVGVPQAIYRDAGSEVQVFFPVDIRNPCPLPFRKDHRQPMVSIHKRIVHYYSLLSFLYLLFIIYYLLFVICYLLFVIRSLCPCLRR